MIAGAGMVFLLIALPTFLLGCNPDISMKTCVNSFMVTSTTVDYHVSPRTCSRCVSYTTLCTSLLEGVTAKQKHSCQTVCARRSYYECYYVYAVERYGNDTRCNLEVGNGYETMDMANSEAMRLYPMGETVDIYVNKQTHNCKTQTTGKILTILGILFFIWSAICLIFYVCVLVTDVSRSTSTQKVIPQYSC